MEEEIEELEQKMDDLLKSCSQNLTAKEELPGAHIKEEKYQNNRQKWRKCIDRVSCSNEAGAQSYCNAKKQKSMQDREGAMAKGQRSEERLVALQKAHERDVIDIRTRRANQGIPAIKLPAKRVGQLVTGMSSDEQGWEDLD